MYVNCFTISLIVWFGLVWFRFGFVSSVSFRFGFISFDLVSFWFRFVLGSFRFGFVSFGFVSQTTVSLTYM